MWVYFLLIILSGCICVLASHKRYTVNSSDKRCNNATIELKYIIALLILWSLVYAFRDVHVGSDTAGYRYYYNRIGSLQYSIADFARTQRDFLFGYVEYFCYRLFKGSFIAFQFVCAILTYLPVLIVLRRYSSNFTQSVLLYFFTLSFYSGFNGTRQAIAVSVSFFAYHFFFLENKYFKYAVLMFIAFGFHSTALFAIPAHFVSRMSVKRMKTKLFLLAIVIGYFFIWQLWKPLIDFFEAIGQSKLAHDYAAATENGSGYLRVLVVLLPPSIAWLYYYVIHNKYTNSTTNEEIMLTLICAVFMLFSTKYWLFARMATYFDRTIILLPKIECIFDKRSKKIWMLLVMVLYIAYMVAILLHGDGGYYPYSFIF